MNESSKPKVQFRIVVGKEASESLEAAVHIVNDGFLSGEVTKSDLATYLFRNAKRFLTKAELQKIRNEFFDDRKALEQLMQNSDSSGRLPEEFRKLLKDQYRSNFEIKE